MSRRVPLIVLGSVLLAVAGIVVLAGVALAVVFGRGDAFATGRNPVSTPTRALVSSVAQIEGTGVAPSALGQPRMEIEASVRSAGHGVFVGLARAVDVDRYLAGADVDVVTDFEVMPFRLATEHQPGTAVVPAPGTQGFWVAHSETTSGTARLSWAVQTATTGSSS